MSVKQVIAVRTDLNMRKGKMAAQAAHASRAFLRAHVLNGASLSDEMLEWLNGSYDTICVGIESDESLVRLHKDAYAAFLPSNIVTDLGKTEFHGRETRTCVAIGPANAERIDRLTRHLKLL